jgi:hypothetical protein
MKLLRIIFLSGLMAMALLLSASPGQVNASPIFDFNMDANHPATASLSYAGGAAPLIGKDISVDFVQLVGDPLSQRNISGGILAFTTGNLTGSDATRWFFGGGGTITLKGGVDLNNDGDYTDPEDIPVGSTLFSGQFNTATVTTFDGQKLLGALFTDTKIEKLTSYYGLPGGPTNFYGGFINLSFDAVGSPPAAFTDTDLLSGDITNKIPEPTALILFGSGLLGAALYRRLRKPKG